MYLLFSAFKIFTAARISGRPADRGNRHRYVLSDNTAKGELFFI